MLRQLYDGVKKDGMTLVLRESTEPLRKFGPE